MTDTKSGFGVEHHSRFPWLEDKYEKLFSPNEYQNIPVISTLFVQALYFGGLLICMLHAFVTKNKK